MELGHIIHNLGIFLIRLLNWEEAIFGHKYGLGKSLTISTVHKMGLVARKSVFGVFDKVRLKPA